MRYLNDTASSKNVPNSEPLHEVSYWIAAKVPIPGQILESQQTVLTYEGTFWLKPTGMIIHLLSELGIKLYESSMLSNFLMIVYWLDGWAEWL